jgi:nucleoid-associated protein YgaU
MEGKAMIALIAIEGAGEDAIYPKSFMKKLRDDWPGDFTEEYIFADGSIWNKASEAHQAALRFVKNGACGLFLAGYSHGGGAAIMAAQTLMAQGIQVDCLALFDAVSKDPGVVIHDPPIPKNVAVTIHAWRQHGTWSRPLWGHCGLKGPNDFRGQSFWVTHGAAGGTKYLLNPSVPANPDQYVEEINFMTSDPSDTRTTWVKEGEDYWGTISLWTWMHSQILSVYAAVSNRPCKPNPRYATDYTVGRGDTLSIISGRQYKDVLLWPILYDANLHVIGTNHNAIVPGQKIAIPNLSGFTQQELAWVRQRGRTW